MGWLCHVADYESVKEYAEYELKHSEGYRLLGRSIYGKEVYSLYEKIETGLRFITVDLVTHSDGEWCRKSMDETCGPYYYNCPEYILVQSTCNNPLAVEWREKCRELRRGKRKMIDAAKNLNRGDVIQYQNEKLTYLYAYNKSVSQIVCRTEAGEIYRYQVKKFKPEWLVPIKPEQTQSESENGETA